MKKILIINGPNLNMLGLREENHYGNMTLEKINELIMKENYFNYEFFQSNHEGMIVDKIQQSLDYDAIVINAAAYTHTSIAIMDALKIFKNIIIEVHLSDISNRENFRKINFISEVSFKMFCGKKEQSYIEAIRFLKNYFSL